MRFVFIRAEKATYPVTVLFRVLEVTRSGYYAFEKRGPRARARTDAQLVVKIRAVHAGGRRKYGSPRVHEKLVAQGERVGRHRVARLM